MPTLTTSFTISLGSNSVTARTTKTNEQGIETEVALAGGDADIEVELVFPAAHLAAGELWLISSGKQITVETNSSSAPDDTFVVPAGGAIRVTELAADIASIFATNADADVATTLTILGVRDGTP